MTRDLSTKRLVENPFNPKFHVEEFTEMMMRVVMRAIERVGGDEDQRNWNNAVATCGEIKCLEGSNACVGVHR
jgi:hypothetical protein